MRKDRALDALLPRVRQAVLATVLLRPRRWFASELVRALGVSQAGLHRELQRLTQAGILVREDEGKHAYYRANEDCPFLGELRSLLVKTAGLVEVARGALEPASDRIRAAFVYGSMARGEELSTSDLDLFVVGDIGLKGIAGAVRKLTERLGRPVNPTVLSAEELRRKTSEGDHFVRSVLDSPKLFVIGSQRELDEVARRELSREEGSDTGRARRAARKDRGQAAARGPRPAGGVRRR